MNPPPVDGYNEPCPFTARQVATRALILHGVVAVAAGVGPAPIIEWFEGEGLWPEVSPSEERLLRDPDAIRPEERIAFQWRQESEWALLWAVGKVEALGLPTRGCATRRLVDELVPRLGDSPEPFLSSAAIRTPGLLLAEDDRLYDLWCRLHEARRVGGALPVDLLLPVLRERVYASEWLHGIDAWDEVSCDT